MISTKYIHLKKHLRGLSLILFILILNGAYAQKEANIWYFGDHAGIDFNSGSPVALTDGAMNTLEGCATISDTNGALLFYTDGQDVWNANHVIMDNGSGLLGHWSASQSAVAVPWPDSTHLYYLFTVPWHNDPDGGRLHYSVIDMSYNGGLGRVTVKNILLFTGITERITAVAHANGSDYWMLTHQRETDAYLAYLITPTGLNTSPVISNIGSSHSGLNNYIGYLKASSRSTYVACAVYSDDFVELFNFDSSTGMLSNPVHLNNLLTPYGIEFSPDESKLYVTEESPDNLFQYDLDAGTPTDILNSQVLINSQWDYGIGAIQLGPDQKIYVVQNGGDSLSVICDPDESGAACNFVNDTIYLESGEGGLGLPTFVQSFFFVGDISYQNECFGDTTFFFYSVSGSFNSILWNFGDPASGANNTSTVLNPYHIFTAPGPYTVSTILVTDTDTYYDTLELTIYDAPAIDLGNDTSICWDGSNTAYFNAGAGYANYLWNTGDTTAVITPDTSGIYTVDAWNFSCHGYDTVQLYVIPAPQADAGSDETICQESFHDFQNSAVLPIAIDYDSLKWSGGNGFFSNDTILIPTYYPAASETGDIQLSLTAYTQSPCNDTTSMMILSIIDGPEADFTFTPSDSLCVDEIISFNGTSTTNITSWSWDFGDGSTANGQSVIYTYPTDGIYTVQLVVVNDSACSDTVSYSLEVHPLPLAEFIITPNDSVCLNTPLTFEATNTTTIIYWEWDFGDGNTATGQNVTHTYNSSGTYKIILLESNVGGCKGTDSIYIEVYPLPSIDTSNLIIDTAGCGIASGSITGIQVNGTMPISYFWLNVLGDTVGYNLNLLDIEAGIYSLFAIDGNGCTNIPASFVVPDDGLMEIDSVLYTDDNCSQGLASIFVYAQEVGSGPISYSINGGLTYLENDGVFIGLSTGSFNVMIKDSNDCEGFFANNPLIIHNIPGPSVISISTVPEQNFNQDGEIELIGFVPEGSIYYSINNGVNFQQDNGLFVGLSAGNYLCMIKDDFGCDTTFDVIVTRVSQTSLEASAGDGNACIGNAVVSPLQMNNFTDVKSFQVKLTYDYDIVQCDGYINLNAELGSGFSANIMPAVGEIYLEWDGQYPLSLPENAVMNELVFSGLEEGTSAVEWQTDAGESIFLDQFDQVINVEYHSGNLKIYSSPEIQMITDKEVCEGDTLIIYPSVVGGSGQRDYTWTGGGVQVGDSILYLPYVQTNHTGQYTLTVWDTLDCEDQASFYLTVNPAPDIAFAGQDTLFVEPGYELHAGSGYQGYLWNTGEHSESIIIDTMGEYSVEVTSYSGCISSATVQISWAGLQLYMPNAFTPNGDGLNDFFKPVANYDHIKQFHMSIFNRWGELVYESSNIYQSWDGTYEGESAMAGVYVYRVFYSSQSGKTETVLGNVMLVR